MPEFTFEGEIGLANLLKEAGLVASTSEANRMVQQGGVKIDGEKVEDPKLVITASTAVYQVGKRKVRQGNGEIKTSQKSTALMAS